MKKVMGTLVENFDSLNSGYGAEYSMNAKGRGEAHPEDLLQAQRYDKICGETVLLKAFCRAREAFVYIVSLEFVLGNMDQLRKGQRSC